MKQTIATAALLAAVALAGMVILGTGRAADEQEPYDEDEYGPEELIVWEKPVKSVFFSHKVHTMDMGFGCDDCHDDLFEMEAGAAEEQDDFTMASMEEGNYCGACHDGYTAFEMTAECSLCHWAPEELVLWTKPVKAVFFDHATHSEDMDCSSCHDDLFIMEAGAAEEYDDFNMESLYAGNYCGACHDGSTAFASDTRCTACHIGVRGYARLMGESGDAAHGSGH